ncbi:CHAT domain-containing protein, partial [Candidatus Parcubacteria bacterium]
VQRERKQWQKAYDSIVKAIRLKYDYVAAYRDFVSVNASLQNAEKALRALAQQHPKLAAVQVGLAHVYGLEMQSDNEREAAKQALELDGSLTWAYFYLSEAQYRAGEYAEARKNCQKGLRLARQNDDVEIEIELLNLSGLIANKQGRVRDALDELGHALSLSQKIGSWEKEGLTRQNLARLYWYVEDFRSALVYANQAYELCVRLDDEEGQASNLNYMAIMHSMLGDYSEALNDYHRARELYRRWNQRGSEAICLGNIAGLYERLGSYAFALDAINESLRLLQPLDQQGWAKVRATYLMVKGKILTHLNENAEAIRHYQEAMELLAPLKTESHQICNLLIRIGEIYRDEGKLDKANQVYRRALQMQPRIFARGVHEAILLGLGKNQLLAGEYTRAQHTFEQAASIAQAIERPEALWRAQAGLARTFEKQDRPLKATEFYERAIRSFESIRDKLQAEQQEWGFLEDKYDVYVRLAGLLYRRHLKHPLQGFDRRAYLVAEKARAQRLLETLYKSHILQNLEDVPLRLKEAYLIKQKQLQEKHLALSEELGKSTAAQDRQVVVTLRGEIDQLELQRSRLLDQIERESPGYHELVNPKAPSVDQLQAELLPENTVIVSYLVGDQESLVWGVTRDTVAFEKIEMTRTELRRALAEISPLFQVTKQPTDVPVDHRWANLQPKLLHDLYVKILQAPLGSLLRRGQTLIVVPDDILTYLPFEILVTRYDKAGLTYLVEEHPVCYIPAVGLLALPRGTPKNASRDLLAFGNPDFGPQSQGLVQWVESRVPFKAIFRGGNFEPLPFAELEVRAIAKVFPRSDVFIGKEATEGNFKTRASAYRYVHLATHNLTDNAQPMYSKIVLARSKDGQEDGFLQTYEVYNLKLNAELVVLSGCSTGLGKLSRGEGLIGMTRAFLYAGASNLMVSLWPVEDRSTSELMRAFYANLKQGMPLPRALQQAKQRLLHAPDARSNPFYWGPFVLIGDSWRAGGGTR